MTEVYEVATFYAHFDVVKEGPPPPPLTVRVCDNLTCVLAGGETPPRRFSPSSVRRTCGSWARLAWVPATHGRPVRWGHGHATGVGTETVAETSKTGTHAHAWHRPGCRRQRCRAGGYPLLRECLDGRRTRDDIINAIERCRPARAGRRRFPTGRNGLRAAEPAPRLMAVNADEGEVGTFKDRYLPRDRPAPISRGHADRRLGGRGARSLYLSPRRISAVRHMLLEEIARLEPAGLDRPTTVHLRRGAGAYICGEESAMLEGSRASAGCRGRSRPTRRRSACSAVPP